ncbi:lysyl-tRNA synthetase, partial [Candidatus Scalindua japonica]
KEYDMKQFILTTILLLTIAGNSFGSETGNSIIKEKWPEIIIASCSIISLAISLVAVYLAGRASNINKRIFKRQGIIDLHMAWRGVNEIDTDNLIGPDVNNAANALDLTASLWNHDVIEKIVLYQSYWPSFKLLYETLNVCNKQVPGYAKSCKAFLSSEMTRAYEDMKKFDILSVKTTSV